MLYFRIKLLWNALARNFKINKLTYLGFETKIFNFIISIRDKEIKYITNVYYFWGQSEILGSIYHFWGQSEILGSIYHFWGQSEILGSI
jgi:hypothetical protein